MKQCDHINHELIPIYWDGELTAEEKLSVDEHVAECDNCRMSLELYKEIHDEVSLDDIELPTNFHEQLMDKLTLQKETNELEAYQKSFFVKYIRYINIVALLAVVAFIGLATLTRPFDEKTAVMTFDTTSTESSDTMATSETAMAEVASESTEAAPESKMMSQEDTATLSATDESIEASSQEAAVNADQAADTSGTANSDVAVSSVDGETADVAAQFSESAMVNEDTVLMTAEVPEVTDRQESLGYVDFISKHVLAVALGIFAVLGVGSYFFFYYHRIKKKK